MVIKKCYCEDEVRSRKPASSEKVALAKSITALKKWGYLKRSRGSEKGACLKRSFIKK